MSRNVKGCCGGPGHEAEAQQDLQGTLGLSLLLLGMMRTPEDIFGDFKARRRGILNALTTE